MRLALYARQTATKICTRSNRLPPSRLDYNPIGGKIIGKCEYESREAEVVVPAHGRHAVFCILIGRLRRNEAAAFAVANGQLDFSAEDGVLKLTFDNDGNVTPKTELVFELMFEDRLRTVSCRPGDPAVGSVTIIQLPNSREVSGHFDLELSHCEDAETGESLGWPPSPFILRGSFDRLIQNHQAE